LIAGGGAGAARDFGSSAAVTVGGAFIVGAFTGAVPKRTASSALFFFFFGVPSLMIPRPINPSAPLDLLDFRLSPTSLPLLPATLLALLLLLGFNNGEVDAATDAASVVVTESLPCDEVVLNAFALVPFFGDPTGVAYFGTPSRGVVCADVPGVRFAAVFDDLGVTPESL
jgi:hypothetical protein